MFAHMYVSRASKWRRVIATRFLTVEPSYYSCSVSFFWIPVKALIQYDREDLVHILQTINCKHKPGTADIPKLIPTPVYSTSSGKTQNSTTHSRSRGSELAHSPAINAFVHDIGIPLLKRIHTHNVIVVTWLTYLSLEIHTHTLG